jgi:hypothetical protein
MSSRNFFPNFLIFLIFPWNLPRYAHRAKSIKNKPKINEDPKDAMIREFQDEIARLKKEVEMRQKGMAKVVINGEEKLVRLLSG